MPCEVRGLRMTTKTVLPAFSNNCPIIEATADGVLVGRCWYYLKQDKCPRHGDVGREKQVYCETGKLTREDKRKDSVLPESANLNQEALNTHGQTGTCSQHGALLCDGEGQAGVSPQATEQRRRKPTEGAQKRCRP